MAEPDLAELLVDGHRILPALLRDLRAAERSIHVSVFLLFRDPIGEEIADVLIERASAGVEVRVLLNVEKIALGDPFSTGEHQMMKHDPNVEHDPLDVKPLCDRMRAAGIAVLDTNIDYDERVHTGNARLDSIGAQISDAIDLSTLHVDHRKIIVVDGFVAYCGGANLGAQYLFHRAFDPAVDAKAEAEAWLAAGDPEPWWKWHDSLTRFEGPIAQRIDEEFHARFILDGGAPYDPQPPVERERRASPAALPVTNARVYVNAPDDAPNEVLALYLEHIAAATRSIFIENPYLYHPTLVAALCTAKEARPSLRITLVLPAYRHNDNSFGQDAQEHHYTRFLRCGIEIHEYANHFNHLKIAVFDERHSIHGSTNLNFRSLERDQDFELVVAVDDEPFARTILAQTRDLDVQHARPITLAEVSGGSLRALRYRWRHPWTRLMLWRRVL